MATLHQASSMDSEIVDSLFTDPDSPLYQADHISEPEDEAPVASAGLKIIRKKESDADREAVQKRIRDWVRQDEDAAQLLLDQFFDILNESAETLTSANPKDEHLGLLLTAFQERKRTYEMLKSFVELKES